MSSTHATGTCSLPALEAGDGVSEGAAGTQAGRLARARAAAKEGWVALRKLLGKQDEEPFDALSGGMNPLVSSYLVPGEARSWRRYWLTFAVVAAAFLWWLGPLMGIFLVDPMIQLMIITPRTDCYNYKLPFQVCEDAGIINSYYLYEITNQEAWLNGSAPPAYREVGPYAFKGSEMRYNVSFNEDWTEVQWAVSYTFHAFETFSPEHSCPTCTLDDTLTVLNRGYQQFYTSLRKGYADMMSQAPQPGPPPTIANETIQAAVMPSILSSVLQVIQSGLSATFGNNATLAQIQWTDCSPLAASAPSPFMPVGQGAWPHHPELCYSLARSVNPNAPEAAVPQLAADGLVLDSTAAAAWLGAAVGNTVGQDIDPAATEFIARFLALGRDTHLAYLSSSSSTQALHNSLQLITQPQWDALKQYLAELAAGFGADAFAGMPAAQKEAVAGMILAGMVKWSNMAAPKPEKLAVYSMLPLAVRTLVYSTASGIQAVQNVSLPAAMMSAPQQWADCSILNAPLTAIAPGVFPHPPEFCAFVMENHQDLGIPFPVAPIMLGELGLKLNATVAAAFLEAVGGRFQYYGSPVHPDEAAAAAVATAFISKTKLEAMAVLNATAPAQAALLNQTLTDGQFQALKLWTINLLPTWGRLMYQGWVAGPDARGGSSGLLARRPVRELLYGYEDAMLRTFAETANPATYRLMPWMYTQSISLAFPSQDFPMEYFSTAANRPVEPASGLSYRDTDQSLAGPNFHPLIQQKRLVTGQRKGDMPQVIKQYRGLPFKAKAQGIFNATGLNEGIVFGSNFDIDEQPTQYESSLERPITSIFTGNFVRVKKVSAYQYTMTAAASQGCNLTLFEAWKNESRFDESVYQEAMYQLAQLKQDQPADYWHLMQNDTALTEHLEGTELGPLNRYFESSTDPAVLRCATPDPMPYAWDFSETWACPTLYTLPRFFKSAAEVVNSSGASWQPNLVDHGWYFSVEPFTGMTIHGHKGYQFNHLVQQTDELYPSLWVAPGSAASQLGGAMGMDADFVTVPLGYVLLSWEPTDTAALVLRGVTTAKEVLYWTLIVGFPCAGWLVLFPALIYLKFSRAAKLRRKALAKIQKSTARKLRLGRHEAAMAEALLQVAAGSTSVFMPPERADGEDSDTVDTESGSAQAEASVGATTAGDKLAAAAAAKEASTADSGAIGAHARQALPQDVPAGGASAPAAGLSAIQAKVAAAERHPAAAEQAAEPSPQGRQPHGSLSIFERQAAGMAGDAAFTIPTAQQGEPGDEDQEEDGEEEAVAGLSGSPDVAVNLLPAGLPLSSAAAAADRAALESWRRSSSMGSGGGGQQRGSLRGGLRRRTTSTQGEP
ncbi:croquemort-like mating [Chlorella sorokiniana]|uniref:Croquemort-like mating n=1 Tax=Chlorella sorokiniana TaxID=3076 RepID=A0A2P6TL25_CHLSO|nr:croquemort-like mating [Chlorella sorokiniana]|eukprot:PRW44956.1 croquemort-like mating [Chlorella sorokiniana]